MFTSDDISLIKTETLEAVVRRDFGVVALTDQVELRFAEFVTSGPGAYEDYSNWREAWRDFVAFTKEDADEDAEEVDAAEATETVIGTFAAGIPAAVLTAEHQISLF
ncbi:hypothetical protein [Marinobacter shengliensis]|uniref:hypothetical protein n=1 Tax=Marinobacter shengliensis TaxID=1389223 RepID=UPI001109322C|nr:hypothetical protein [Marinobacter shengliensis]